MKIIKPTSLGILTRTYRSAAREHLGIAVPLLATLEDIPRLLGESALWDIVREELGAYTLDAALPKPHGEFLVSARAYGKYCGADHACEVGARFAGIEKRLRVTGDRVPFDELPFDELPIDWPLAYGGPGFADNPRGRGFAPGPHSTPQSAPQVAYAAPGPLRPASFTPIAADWPARRALYGKLDQQWLDEDRPGFPRSLDRRYFNIAPLDQQLPAHLTLPDAAAYEFTRLHSERDVLRGVLPALRARCFVKRRESGSLEEIPMRLTTAWFVPHRERVAMIFHGETVIDEFDARDVECLLLAVEMCGDARAAGHYRHVFDLRHDPEHGVLHALRDADLMPEFLLSRDDAPQTSTPAWQGNLMRRARREAEIAGTRVPAVAAAFEADGFTPPRLSELAEFVARSERQASEQRAALETRRNEVEAKRSASKPLPDARRGPPAAPSAQHVRRCGMPDAGRRLRDAYRHAAHFQGAAPSLSAAASQALRARIGAGDCVAGFDLTGADLTGADLSGMNLRGANLSGALLESADLTDTDLSDAILAEAVLVRATLTRTRLSGANLATANLSLAQCEDTDFTGATLDGCVAERTRFLRCRFRLASIRRAQFRECTFDSADFSNATLADLAFTEQVLSDANFKGATIRKLAFVNCRLERARFSGADIEGFGLVETIARDIDFNMVSLKKACFVKNTVLAGADFTKAVLVEVNLREADLRGARFDHASIVQSDFSDANLQAASLLSVRIENGYLVRADLRGAALSRADLINACLRRADLRGADLRETNLFRADLAEASLDRATRLDGAYLEQAVFHPLASAPA